MNIDGTPPDATGARVLLVEDHELLAQSLIFTLKAEGVCPERAPLGSAEEVLAAASEGRYDVVLLDLDLGDAVGSGLHLIEPLQRTGARVVMLTAATDREQLAECIEAGAVGLIPKTVSFEHLLAAVREAVSLGNALSPGQRDELLAELRRQRREREERMKAFKQLTRREAEVLAALMDGKSAEEIATEWFTSIATVRSQIRAVLGKLRVRSQVAAIGLARRAGWDIPADR